MQYRALGKTGINVSAVVYGGIVSTDEVQADSDRHVEWAISQGINYFDVAPTYGDAQLKLGNSLIPYRDKIYLACKTEARTAKEARVLFEESRRLLHTDYFDNYQMHALSKMSDIETAFGPGGIMELMAELKEKGLIRHIGITAHSEEVALEAIRRFDFDTVLFPFNWMMHMKHGMGARLLVAAKEKGMGVLSMKSFVERRWDSDAERYASRYPKSWCKPIDVEEADFALAAMKYALSLGVDTLVPPGNFESFSFNVEHIEECLAHPYSEQDEALLREKLAVFAGKEFFDPALGKSIH
ncbi:MAG: aldo/keto reductase [Clostridia bacterium]|nr:aldo/keto reductase [Clostridia bacterium]MBR2288546.1 aldo/keto reductase [Clostridia bacterium]